MKVNNIVPTLFSAAALTSLGQAASSNTTIPDCGGYTKLYGNDSSIVSSIIFNETFRNETKNKLVNAVKIPTITEADFPDPADEPDFEGWQVFKKFHQQLEKDFPKVWSNLNVETVNEFSLIITWNGTDESLKPNVFSAHQDVVPIDNYTLAAWEHEPFSGYWDGTYVWGRGSFDDKNMLISMLQSMEYILENEPEFNPNRTVILVSGCDEEISGYYGAAYINKVLLERYGENGIYSIIDEGGNAITNLTGVWVAAPGVSEKGLMNLEISINGTGGHASTPPDHTNIGIAAQLITTIEDNKFPVQYTNENPISQFFTCIIDKSPLIPKTIKQTFANAFTNDTANEAAISFIQSFGGEYGEYFIRGSQAVDVIDAGNGDNQLPTFTSLTINSRIAPESNSMEQIIKFGANAASVALKNGLGLVIQNNTRIPCTRKGCIVVDVTSIFEPSPVSPTNDVWDQLAGTIRGYFEDVVFPHVFGEDKNTTLYVAPSLMTANSDSKHYWNLTENIYRYQPGFANFNLTGLLHAADEHIDLDTVMHAVGFFYEYIHILSQ
ncbi:hypothetical protein TPHA_0Q00110 [Tetrapisispora phaffii CBS 4417]|uniref:Peptidase M20 dimerisation domain-containing protein n=1 Tax=Tetrapisispora phaffii (strain ATCC 24235 / CBS 4417 / NBRC 1672 / NRRL Y-8282 / UCD 70-5) TaxID=1071381 RepID=G8C2G7_TETPH|nr:hypothetical protein TPHA_0Q00110 [Tetrapisispora phaffii CBS 4417]CCE66345.1 hypothetical protein TPHA_0Q00110 [Tetrapisispora phaffii CBS 4417]